MYKDYKELLRFMSDECKFLDELLSKGLTYETLQVDEILKRAIVKSIENIGEAGSKIPFEQRDKWNTIAWKEVVGIRMRLAHDYWGVNYEIVWDVLVRKVPVLKTQIENILNG